MVGTLILTLRGALDFADLKGWIEDRLMAVDRFRQAVSQGRLPLARPRWREVDRFALKDHLERLQPEPAGDRASLLRLAAHVAESPLDASKPLWKVSLVEMGSAGSALILRVHQAIVDALALPRLLERLADETPSHGEETGAKATAESEIPGFAAPISREPFLRAAEIAGSNIRQLGRLITMRSDRSLPISSSTAGEPSWGWRRLASRSRLERLATLTGCAPAEALLAAATAALRRSLEEGGRLPEAGDPRAILAVDLRREQDGILGTRLGLAPVLLPVGRRHAGSRLRAIRERLRAAERTPDELLSIGAPPTSGLTMSELEERTLRLAAEKASVLIAFVRGPLRVTTLCGRPIESLMCWPSLPRGLALALTFLDHGGAIEAGAWADGSLALESEGLLAAIEDELEALSAGRET